MPVMDGYTAVGKMRERGLTLPVIALTGHAMKGAEEACRRAGYSGYMSKPIDIDALIERLAEDLDGDFQDWAPEPQITADAAGQEKSNLAFLYGEPANSAANEVQEPILSSLPGDSDRYGKIITRFVGRLQQQVDAIETALAQGDLQTLQELGHWLKGSAGSVGFHVFDEPGLDLETFAKAGNEAGLRQVVAQIRSLTTRVVLSYPPQYQESVAAAPEQGVSQGKCNGQSGPVAALPEAVTSTMLNNAKLRPLVGKFVTRLSQQLDHLEQAFEASRLDEVADLAHWLKGSAGTVGFDVFTEPAAELEMLVNAEQNGKAREKITTIRALYERIELPVTEESA